MNPLLIRRFEEISNNAWPALRTLQYDGWVLRFAGGVTKRSNSVTMLYPSGIDPAVKVDFCESMYQNQGIAPCFKVTPASLPGEIDGILATKGYFLHSTISFQTLDLSLIRTSEDQDVLLASDLHGSWMDDFIRMNEFDPNRKSIYMAIMEALTLPKCMVTVTKDNRVAGVGLGVREGTFLGLFDIVIDPLVRRTGLGYKVVNALLGWGKRTGAETAYLQVLSDNVPAIGLYEKMGFREGYRYWYRMKS